MDDWFRAPGGETGQDPGASGPAAPPAQRAGRPWGRTLVVTVAVSLGVFGMALYGTSAMLERSGQAPAPASASGAAARAPQAPVPAAPQAAQPVQGMQPVQAVATTPPSEPPRSAPGPVTADATTIVPAAWMLPAELPRHAVERWRIQDAAQVDQGSDGPFYPCEDTQLPGWVGNQFQHYAATRPGHDAQRGYGAAQYTLFFRTPEAAAAAYRTLLADLASCQARERAQGVRTTVRRTAAIEDGSAWSYTSAPRPAVSGEAEGGTGPLEWRTYLVRRGSTITALSLTAWRVHPGYDHSGDVRVLRRLTGRVCVYDRSCP